MKLKRQKCIPTLEHFPQRKIQPLPIKVGGKQRSMKPYFNKLKTKWNINSNFQLLLIFVVFSLAGFSVVRFRKLFFMLVGIEDDTALWIKTITYILCIFPAYQLLLLVYGFLLGQFGFFWEKEKRLFKAIAKRFK